MMLDDEVEALLRGEARDDADDGGLIADSFQADTRAADLDGTLSCRPGFRL